MEHSLHIIILSAGLLAGLIIWFWDSIRNKGFKRRSFTVLLLILFALLHVSPLGLMAVYHHQSQDHSSYHPCCMPQNATTPAPFTTLKPILVTDNFIDILPIVISSHNIKNLNTRSPPTPV